MASIGHEISYRSGQKNHWRRWVWNRITETLPKGIRPRDATVLYLPGEADLDWPEARRRGYQRENMIACERDPRVVRALRARGVTTISLSLALAMQAWPQGRPVHVVHADLCSGITSDLLLILQELFREPFANSVASLNLLRGRDPISTNINNSPLAGMFPAQLLKHRGCAALIIYGIMMGQYMREDGATFDEAKQVIISVAQSMSHNSYQQDHCVSVMDSIVFKSRMGFFRHSEALTPKARRARRALAAALAIQTMRKQGTLPSRAATV